jgi:hypothetical protein
MFLYTAITYWTIRNFGAATQAGFGIGGRIMHGAAHLAVPVASASADRAVLERAGRDPKQMLKRLGSIPVAGAEPAKLEAG